MYLDFKIGPLTPQEGEKEKKKRDKKVPNSIKKVSRVSLTTRGRGGETTLQFKFSF